MSLAQWIWFVSWSLCGLAFLILLGLIAYRGAANRRDAHRGSLRAHQIELFKARAEKAAVTPGAVAGSVLANLAVDILELVRGDEKAAFAERVAEAGVAARLRLRLSRGRVQTRILAASALAHFKDGATVGALTASLDDPNREVRLTAALSLAAHGNLPPAREVIRRLGIGHRETSLRTVMLLVDLAHNDVEDVRSLLIDPAIAPAMKAGAAEALARCDDFAAVPLISDLVVSGGATTREVPRLLDALAELEHPAATEAVLHGLASPAPLVRAAAARAAGRIMVVPALKRLEWLLGDPDWWVRFYAGEALLLFGDQGKRRLRRAARGIEEPARETAAALLAEHAFAQ